MAATTTGSKPVITKTGLMELRSKIKSLENENGRLRKLIEDDSNTVWCYMCNKKKNIGEFYASTDMRIASRVTPICKDCARRVAFRVDAEGNEYEPTKQSVIDALRYLDKPFLLSVWNASVDESNAVNTGKKKNNVWTSYIKNIQLKNYYGMTFSDSDFFKSFDMGKLGEIVDNHIDITEDAMAEYYKNRNDVIRLLSYDPFENESEEDKPLLYSQLLGLLDSSEDANDDMMRTASCISIVRAFLQQAKIDDATAKVMGDYMQISQNMTTIKAMQDSKKSLTMTISSLAKDNCISLQYNKGAKKGENTWTGKIKKIKELNLREGEVNGFDMDTCRGMRQVMDASHKSLIEQLKLDESEYGEIIAGQREMVVQANQERDKYKELNRIILRENIDLRDTLNENGLLNEENLIDLSELYSPFSSQEEDNAEET